jgi:citrate lyase subunit beta/citryl-CoA lyase
MEARTQLIRSWMFVPGHRRAMIDKAMGLTADAVMLDLEDGVTPGMRAGARQQVTEALAEAARLEASDTGYRTPARYVRVNPAGSPQMIEDLEAIVRPGLNGLVIPKVDSTRQIAVVEDVLGRLETERHVPPGSVRLLITIESPAALFAAPAIAASSARATGLMFGIEDFCRSMALPLRREGEAADLLYPRSHLAIAAAGAHIQAIDGVWTDLSDRAGLRRYARQARRLGMTGMAIIHPTQIEDANAAFTPTAEEADYARAVMQAYEAARARGDGATSFQGQMLDPPIVERARQTMALCQSLGVN